jgi:hypothetical protein
MAPPGSLNRMIDVINKMFPDMKLNISRPGGTQLNAIVEIHLERILKVGMKPGPVRSVFLKNPSPVQSVIKFSSLNFNFLDVSSLNNVNIV